MTAGTQGNAAASPPERSLIAATGWPWRIGVVVTAGFLLLRLPAMLHGFGMDDAVQGQLGDCYFISALASVAKSTRQRIRQAEKEKTYEKINEKFGQKTFPGLFFNKRQQNIYFSFP